MMATGVSRERDMREVYVIPGRASARTSDVRLRIGESRDSGFDASHRPGMTASTQLDPCPRRGVADIFLRLLEGAFQRPRRRHVADLSEMRGHRVRRPIGRRQVNALGFHDLDYRERARAGTHD